MGRVFLLIVSLFSHTTTYADQIELPDNPSAPPRLGDDYYKDSLQKNLRRKRGIRAKRKPKAKPSEYWQKKMDDDLRDLSKRPLNMDFGFNLGVGAIGLSQTSGPRKGYSIDPPVIFRAFWSLNESKNNSETKLWLGFRSAFISGWGSYENIPGRFGFAYYGPMLGVGKINPLEVEPDKNKMTVRTAYMSLFGISAASQFGYVGESVDPPDKDIKNGSEFDSPGLWAEFQYMWVHYSSIELSAFGGVQTGDGKLFFYVGTNVGGWI